MTLRTALGNAWVLVGRGEEHSSFYLGWKLTVEKTITGISTLSLQDIFRYISIYYVASEVQLFRDSAVKPLGEEPSGKIASYTELLFYVVFHFSVCFRKQN